MATKPRAKNANLALAAMDSGGPSNALASPRWLADGARSTNRGRLGLAKLATMTLAQRQRAALCDNFELVGALAPTLCGDWLTQDLAAHLWIREHKLAALPGIGSARFAARTQQIQIEALHRFGYLGLVSRLRRVGPIMAPLDRVVNASEYLIHNFDLARANDLSVDLTMQDQTEVLPVVKLFARLTQRGFKGRLVVEPEGFDSFAVGQGAEPTHVVGLPSELLLWFSGRDWARVEVIGEAQAREQISQARTAL